MKRFIQHEELARDSRFIRQTKTARRSTGCSSASNGWQWVIWNNTTSSRETGT